MRNNYICSCACVWICHIRKFTILISTGYLIFVLNLFSILFLMYTLFSWGGGYNLVAYFGKDQKNLKEFCLNLICIGRPNFTFLIFPLKIILCTNMIFIAIYTTCINIKHFTFVSYYCQLKKKFSQLLVVPFYNMII